MLKPERPKHEDCELKCDIQEREIVGGFKGKVCGHCFFVFEYEKIDQKQEAKNKIIEDREEKLDRTIVDASRKEKSEKYKTKINIKELYEVRKIKSQETHEWLKYKHYAKRIPMISYAYGLFEKKSTEMKGVVTYGSPCRSLNMGYGCFGGEIEINTYELNRLCVEDKLPTNTLSYFVGESLKMLNKDHKTDPVCVVSYADGNQEHHGYIYQATNWIYTGETQAVKIFFDVNTKKNVHARTIVSRYGSSSDESLPDNINYEYEKSGKFRYFQFLGNKSQVKLMKKNLKYGISDYPKGKNERYDSSHKTINQLSIEF